MKTKNLLKKILTSISFALFSFATAQNIIIVDNNLVTPNSQKNLQDAVNNATPGSIILVQPSQTSYGDLDIDKSITIIGKSSSDPKSKTILNDVNLKPGSSNSVIQGLEISNLFQQTDGVAEILENVKVRNCKVGYLRCGSDETRISQAKNWILEGNSIDQIQVAWNTENLVIRNNILLAVAISDTPTNITITQNVFRGNSNINAIGTQSIITVTNSIFVGNSDYFYNYYLTRLYGKVNLQNCLTYNYGGTHIFDIYDDSGDNHDSQLINVKQNMNPLFVNVNGNQFTNESDVSIANFNNINIDNDDLHLQNNSPAKGAGINGEDLGIYHNYNFSNYGYPEDIPRFKVLTSPSTVPTGENFQITIKTN